MKTPVLETARLILRPITLEDTASLQHHFNNWEIIKNLAAVVPWPYPEDGQFKRICHDYLPAMERDEMFVWAIARKDDATQQAIGVIYIGGQGQNHGQRGFWIATPFQRRGLITEAVAATNEYVFETLDYDQFYARNAKSNAASRRIKERTGGIYIKDIDGSYVSGEKVSELWLITKESWLDAKRRMRDLPTTSPDLSEP